MLTVLPKLQVLDGLAVSAKEAAQAKAARERVAAAAAAVAAAASSGGSNTKGRRPRPGAGGGGGGGTVNWEENLSVTAKMAERENARIQAERREKEQREKLAQFQNLEVLRAKSLKEAPVSQ